MLICLRSSFKLGHSNTVQTYPVPKKKQNHQAIPRYSQFPAISSWLQSWFSALRMATATTAAMATTTSTRNVCWWSNGQLMRRATWQRWRDCCYDLLLYGHGVVLVFVFVLTVAVVLVFVLIVAVVVAVAGAVVAFAFAFAVAATHCYQQ